MTVSGSGRGHATVSRLIAEYLVAQGVSRIYGLCGGHIQPIWDAAAAAGIQIVDTRHEAAAVYMAQAESILTGTTGIALVTAGPGLTNAMTGIANASVAGDPVVVISGRPPRPQAGMGAMQELPQAELVRRLCVRAEEVSAQRHVVPRLAAVFAAARGHDGRAGPAYIDFPTDLLYEDLAGVDVPDLRARPVPRGMPSPEAIASAAEVLAGARRLLVIAGAAVRQCVPELRRFLAHFGGTYLDTGESRGALPAGHPAHVPAMRSRAMRDADVVVTLGRRLDFQLGYGSAAVFPGAKAFVRVGSSFDEVGANRRGEVEIKADVAATLTALVDAAEPPVDPDRAWVAQMVEGNAARSRELAESMRRRPATADSRMHPFELVSAVNEFVTDEAVVVADGGDILSFARVGLRQSRYLDCGALGCLGVGVPFAIAAALTGRGRPVIALIGDGAFGFTGFEIDTAVRHRSRVLFIVANNEAWNIERNDQLHRFDGRLVGVDLPGCRYSVVAEGLGAYAERVEDPGALREAISRCLDNTPAVLEVMVTRDAVSPDFRNGLAEVPSLQALAPWNAAESAVLDQLRVGPPVDKST